MNALKYLNVRTFWKDAGNSIRITANAVEHADVRLRTSGAGVYAQVLYAISEDGARWPPGLRSLARYPVRHVETRGNTDRIWASATDPCDGYNLLLAPSIPRTAAAVAICRTDCLRSVAEKNIPRVSSRKVIPLVQSERPSHRKIFDAVQGD